MDLSMLKAQVMAMFMMRPGSANGGNGGSGGNQDIYQIIWTMIMMSAIEWFFKSSSTWIPVAGAWVSGQFAAKKEQWMPKIPALTDASVPILSSVTLVRSYAQSSSKADDFGRSVKPGDNGGTNSFIDRADAVLDYIATLDVTRHVRLESRCMVADTDEIELAPLLKARIKNSGGGGSSGSSGSSTSSSSSSSGKADEKGSVEIVLYSSKLRVSEIRAWIETTLEAWTAEKHNKLGSKIYYFNEVPIEPQVVADMSQAGGEGQGAGAVSGSGAGPKKSYRWETAPKSLSFTMNEFHTNKSFDNVYGSHVVELRERLDLFVNHPEWYKERGIPYTLGILLHGVPGAGKTSTIKAIAHDTHSHIFSLSLRPYTSQRQLMNLFYTDTVHIQGGQSYQIPQARRLYVIEDIDCLTNVVVDRAIRRAEGMSEEQESGDAVTLGFLLNLIDGVLEMPGRKMIISANYPDRLDKALIRPGRIDVKIAFERADRGFIAEMMTGFYKRPIGVDDVPADLAHCFTPAEVTEACCRFYKSAEGAIGYLVGKAAAAAAASSGEGTPLEDIIGMRIEEIPVASVAPIDHVTPVDSVASVAPADSVASATPAEQPVVDDRPIISRAVEERSLLAAQSTTDAIIVEPKEVPVKIPTLCQSEEFYNILLANRRQYEDVIDTVSSKMEQAEKEWYGATDSDIASAKFEEPDTSGWGPLGL